MDLHTCVSMLVNDSEFFAEVADLYYEIVDDKGQAFYDNLDPSAIVPAIGLGDWAIMRDGLDYWYDFVENENNVSDAVLTLSELTPLLELYPYDYFETRADLADYIYAIASTK